MVADGQSTRTLAVESEDQAAVVALVRRMGLDGWVNTSYARGLAALIDGEPERYAVIDVGTNSVKFHVGQRDGARGWRKVVDRAEVTRLGEGLNTTGAIAPDALRRTAAALAGDGRRSAAARRPRDRGGGDGGRAHRAEPRGGPGRAARRRPASRVEAISGDEEARLAYLAAVAGLGVGAGPVVVFDTGGGSSSSPSAVARRWTSASASTWARWATRSGSDSRVPSRRRSSARFWRPSRRDLAGSTAGPGRTPWWEWAAPSPTWRR